MAYIYLIINKINGKLYVGKTENTIDERWREHKQDYKKERCEKRPLYDAMIKYGIENFEIKELEYLKEGGKLLSEREEYWITKLLTYGHNGYNATKGGDGKTLYDHEEIINLIKQQYTTKLIIEKIGCSKYLVYDIAKLNNLEIRTSKLVGLFDKDGNLIQTFYGCLEAQKWLIDNNITNSDRANSCISKCCLGLRKSAYKYIWKYIEE